MMCQADLLWASLGTGKESSTYIPSKLFEYIAAKRPIIGFFPEGDAELLIKEAGFGTVFSTDDPAPIISFLTGEIRNRGESLSSDILGTRRTDVLAKYEITDIAKRFADILNDLISIRQGLK